MAFQVLLRRGDSDIALDLVLHTHEGLILPATQIAR